MNKKNIARFGGLFLTVLALTACDKTNQAFDGAKQFAGQLISKAAPKAENIAAQLPTVSPEELALEAQNYVRPTPDKTVPVQTLYFHSDGKAASEAAASGFYREVFGQTADGRWVVQDFYQDSKLPQTTALTLKNGADVHIFDTSTLNGRNIWFHQSGGLHSVADYVDGVRQGAQAFYQNKQLVGAVLAQKMLVFHHDGNIMAIMEHDEQDPSIWQTTLFRQDGSALVQSRMRGEQVLSATAWQSDGTQIRKQADLEQAKTESLPLVKRTDEVLRLMNE